VRYAATQPLVTTVRLEYNVFSTLTVGVLTPRSHV
jgi:hypothetical protein